MGSVDGEGERRGIFAFMCWGRESRVLLLFLSFFGGVVSEAQFYYFFPHFPFFGLPPFWCPCVSFLLLFLIGKKEENKNSRNVQAWWPLRPDGCPHGHGRRGRRGCPGLGLGRREPRPARCCGVPVPGVGARQEQQAGARRRRCCCCCLRCFGHRRRALFGL